MSKKPNIAVVGATGLVGRTMIKVLDERKFPLNSLQLYASERSAGETIKYQGYDITVQKLDEHSFDDVDIALFSAGGGVSKKFAPIAAEKGCVVVDNSSAWRMEKDIPLVVPEVNGSELEKHKNIIANPNCSTIQLVAAIKPIFDKYGIHRLVCSTYQSISGAGQKGIDKLMSEIKGEKSDDKHPIAFNTMFHQLSPADGFTEEENKMWNEIRKILNKEDMNIAITCVRLPIFGGHGESVNLELEKEYEIGDIREMLQNTPGLVIIDDMANDEYPTPQIASDKDEVFIGRLHEDHSAKNGLYMWVVADNLRKGAATNAVQIAEMLVEKDLWGKK